MAFQTKRIRRQNPVKKRVMKLKKRQMLKKGLAASFKKPQPSRPLALLLSQARWHYQSAKQMNLNQLWQVSQKSWTLKAPDGLKICAQSLKRLVRKSFDIYRKLAQITAAGGQLGVAEENLIAFTRLTADMATAFDISAESAGDSMAKLANIFSKPIEEMGEFGDMINTISNNMPAKASEIVESLTRIGGTAKAFGLAEKKRSH